MTYLIDISGACISYPLPEGDRKIVLDEINLKVQQGEFVTVVGPSGCGKSTLLRLVFGTQFPNGGTVLVDGAKVARVTRDCGIVFQDYLLYQFMTVLDNIGFGRVLEETTLLNRLLAKPFQIIEYLLNEAVQVPSRAWHSTRSRAIRTANWGRAFPARVANKTLPLAAAAGNLFVGGLFARKGMAAPTGRFKVPAPYELPVPYKLPAPRQRNTDKTPIWTRAFEFCSKYFRVRKRARAEAAELMKSVGLDVRDGEKYSHELSGGMKQRVAIAQAILMQPKILLMDEPFGALDAKTRVNLQDFIHDCWQKHGLTVFFVTHDLEESVKLGTRLICLSQYWTQDNGERGIGARIVRDMPVEGGATRPSEFHDSPEFTALVTEMRESGLKADKLIPRAAFNLTHRDAFVAQQEVRA